MPARHPAPHGRAVGDEDASTGPMDDVPPGRAAGKGMPSPDMASIEADRAKSSGRPPLADDPAVGQSDGDETQGD